MQNEDYTLHIHIIQFIKLKYNTKYIKLLLITGVQLEGFVGGTNKGWRGVFKDAGDQFTKEAFDTSVSGTVVATGPSLLFTNYAQQKTIIINT